MFVLSLQVLGQALDGRCSKLHAEESRFEVAEVEGEGGEEGDAEGVLGACQAYFAPEGGRARAVGGTAGGRKGQSKVVDVMLSHLAGHLDQTTPTAPESTPTAPESTPTAPESTLAARDSTPSRLALLAHGDRERDCIGTNASQRFLLSAVGLYITVNMTDDRIAAWYK